MKETKTRQVRVFFCARKKGFDKPNLFKGAWNYYKIPAGTNLPEGLVIVRDYYNPSYEATHYTVAPAYDMPLERFKALLAALAKLLEKDVSCGS